MITFSCAIQKDIALTGKKEGNENEIVDVANAYEDILRFGNAPLEAYFNLACLCWCVTDFGLASAFHVGVAYEEFAEKRWKEVLSEADRRFPNNPEIRFWSLYCRCFGGCYDVDSMYVAEESEKLVKMPGCTLVPYFHLFAHSRGQRYRSEASKLSEMCRKQTTIKNQYIISILASSGDIYEKDT